MIFYPAIDIKDGKCIRLTNGLLEKIKVYDVNPINQAKIFEKNGAKWIHIVDIDGAFSGRLINQEVIKYICSETTCKIQVGGGIRKHQDIQNLFSCGVERIILGTAAVKDPKLVKDACENYPGKIALGLDSKNNKIALEGWSESSSVSEIELIKKYENVGISHIIYTDISRDGLLSGLNIQNLKYILSLTKINIIASGGVSCEEDLINLKKIDAFNLNGVICGKAIYEGKIKIDQAIKILNK